MELADFRPSDKERAADAREALWSQAVEQSTGDSKSFTERALEGFLESGVQALKHPGETALKVGSGVALGAVLQVGLNNAEMMGGRIGAAARLGKLALMAVPLTIAGGHVLAADDSAGEAGKMAFEMGLFLTAAKLGSYADRIPGAGRLLGPRATTELPESFKYQVVGDKVRFSGNRMGYFGNTDGAVHQVRLANGKGFVPAHHLDGEIPLVEMPRELPGIGRLEYGPRSTTLVTEKGSFTRDVMGRTTSTVKDGHTISTSDGKSFNVVRPNGDHVGFEADGRVSATQGSYESGTAWAFEPGGAVSMRSLPAGKYKFEISAEGEGNFTYTHGTSRGIRGIGGPRVRHAPLKRDELPFSVTPGEANINTPHGTWVRPDITAPTAADKSSLSRAKEALDLLLSQRAVTA